jgi:hypothetical protein
LAISRLPPSARLRTGESGESGAIGVIALVLLCVESSTPSRDTVSAMSEESLEDFIRRPFIAEPAHAQKAPF